MQLPTIHASGTSKKSLVGDLCKARAALQVALHALRETTPNGRDYYPQGPHAYKIALNEHADRVRRLVAIKDEIDQLTIAIDRIGE